MSKKIDLGNLSGGAVGERIALEINRVLSNIDDPNTEATAARKLVLTITFKPDEEREVVRTGITARVSLAPPKEILTKLILDRDADGQVVGAELISNMKNQLMINNEGDVADHSGIKVVDITTGFNRFQTN